MTEWNKIKTLCYREDLWLHTKAKKLCVETPQDSFAQAKWQILSCPSLKRSINIYFLIEDGFMYGWLQFCSVAHLLFEDNMNILVFCIMPWNSCWFFYLKNRTLRSNLNDVSTPTHSELLNEMIVEITRHFFIRYFHYPLSSCIFFSKELYSILSRCLRLGATFNRAEG